MLKKIAKLELPNYLKATNNPLTFPSKRETKTHQKQIAKILIIACLIPLLFFIIPAGGQAIDNYLEKAPVELNGQELFEVAELASNFSATKNCYKLRFSLCYKAFTASNQQTLNSFPRKLGGLIKLKCTNHTNKK